MSRGKLFLIRGVMNVLLPVLLSLVLGGIIIAFSGGDPFRTYLILFSRALFDFKGIMKTLHYSAPLILTGLAIAISFKSGLFNMGVEGQFLVGGYTVALVGYHFGYLPTFVLVPLCMVAAIVVAVITAMIPALLKAFYNVNEMVVTLLLNYAILLFLEFLSSSAGPFGDPRAGNVQTNMISDGAILGRLFGSKLTIFFVIVMVVFLYMCFVFYRSRLGYEITAMGHNLSFSEAVGMRPRRKIVTILAYSGVLSGLAGAGWMMAEKYTYTLSFSGSPGLGWDGMLIALLGANSPVGILIAAIFYAALKTGSLSIAVYTDVPSEIIILIQALLITLLSLKMFRRGE